MTTAARKARATQTSPLAHEHQPLPGSLALDLINTEVMDRGKWRDLLPSPDALARWWEDACEDYPDECVMAGTGEVRAWTSELLEAIKALRMALRTVLTQVIEKHAVAEADLQPINEILALGSPVLEGTGEGNVKMAVHLRDPRQVNVLLPIALSALRLFTERDWRRLHQCNSDRCIIFFYDTTRSGTRRWCTPVCMNRARSIKHYQLTKKRTSPQQ